MSRPNITQAQLDTFHNVLGTLMGWARQDNADYLYDQLFDMDCNIPTDISEFE